MNLNRRTAGTGAATIAAASGRPGPALPAPARRTERCPPPSSLTLKPLKVSPDGTFWTWLERPGVQCLRDAEHAITNAATAGDGASIRSGGHIHQTSADSRPH